MGLAISKRMVELMDGRIWAEGELGNGSTFAFTALFGLSDPEEAYLAPQDFLKGKSALCVDDCPEALEALAESLGSLGLRVEKASSGLEAAEKLRHWAGKGEAFNFAVVDALSGEMDAPALARLAAGDLAPELQPAMILAAPEGHPALAASKDLGFKAVVLKPVTASGLVASLAEAAKVSKSVKGWHRKAVSAEVLSVAHLRGARILLAEDN